MENLFRKFVRLHACAWIADSKERISDKALNEAWAKSNAAERDLRDAIEKLEAKVAGVVVP